MSKVNYIKLAKNSAKTQILELKKINSVFNKSFIKAVDLIANCKGKLITAGIGKSGLIARKVSATMSSVGVSSFYLNPGEANHGDLGQIDKRDVLLVFSFSGNTSEITNMLKYSNRFNIRVIGVTAKKNSLLTKASDVNIILPNVNEADPTGMVPTTSTTISLLFGDCLAVALMSKIKFSKERFKIFHPGGNIGQALLLVKDLMLTGNKIPTISPTKSIYDAIKVINKKKLGLVVIKDKKNIKGILTDGDARRNLKRYSKSNRVKDFMTKKPISVDENSLASKALSLMNEKKITSLLVTSKKNHKSLKLRGILHIHSLLQYGIK